MKWSLKLGKLFGIDIRLHFTFLLLLAFLGLYFWRTTQDTGAALQGVAFIVALFGCIVLHELGHALMARCYGNLDSSQIEKLDRSTPILVYGDGGHRSRRALKAISEDGFHSIYHINRGFMMRRLFGGPYKGKSAKNES